MLLKTRGPLLRSAPTRLGQASGRVGPCVPTRSGHGRFFGDAWANRSRDVLSPTAFVRDGRIENITNNKNRKKASIMAKFMCTHTLPAGKFSADQLRQFAQAAQMDPNVKGYRSFANLADQPGRGQSGLHHGSSRQRRRGGLVHEDGDAF